MCEVPLKSTIIVGAPQKSVHLLGQNKSVAWEEPLKKRRRSANWSSTSQLPNNEPRKPYYTPNPDTRKK